MTNTYEPKIEEGEDYAIVTWTVPAQKGEIIDDLSKQIAEMVDEEDVMKATLLFEEIFVNIANYAYQGVKADKTATIQCTLKIGKPLQMQFIDNGKEFDPTQYDYGGLNEEQIGGHGIRMMKELSSLFTYQRINNQNVLTISL